MYQIVNYEHIEHTAFAVMLHGAKQASKQASKQENIQRAQSSRKSYSFWSTPLSAGLATLAFAQS